MGAQVVDYRVSAIVVLCKDCGNDVGLYPARHKCKPIDRPPMPPLPLKFNDTLSPEISSPSTSMWASLRSKASSESVAVPENNEESIYFNNFARNLPDANDSGKKLWGKVRQNDKWKQLNEKNEKPKQSGKLWGKLMQATQTVSHDDRGAESDDEDWDGETHVSRILREYYEKERLPLPVWLFEENRARKQKMTENDSSPARTPSRRRLWDNDAGRELSSREKERQELRQQPVLPETETSVDSRRRPSNREPKDYYDEKRRYEDQREYHKEERGYHRPENTYYSSQPPSRYPVNQQTHSVEHGRGAYRSGNERYNNYF